MVAEGQPFHLNLITALATCEDDVDAMYPKDVASGVPLGVTTPTWTSPGIWLTKEELKGESPAWEDLSQPEQRHHARKAKEPQLQATNCHRLSRTFALHKLGLCMPAATSML